MPRAKVNINRVPLFQGSREQDWMWGPIHCGVKQKPQPLWGPSLYLYFWSFVCALNNCEILSSLQVMKTHFFDRTNLHKTRCYIRCWEKPQWKASWDAQRSPFIPCHSWRALPLLSFPWERKASPRYDLLPTLTAHIYSTWPDECLWIFVHIFANIHPKRSC